MTRIFNDPAEFAEDQFAGFLDLYADRLRGVPGALWPCAPANRKWPSSSAEARATTRPLPAWWATASPRAPSSEMSLRHRPQHRFIRWRRPPTRGGE